MTHVNGLPTAPAAARAADLGDATATLTASGPGASIKAPAPEFVMASSGRGSFPELEEQGDLVVDGDRELADAFLAKLRVV